MHRIRVSVLHLQRLVQHAFAIPALLVIAIVFLAGIDARAQQLTGDLSGTVYDPAGASVPNATVVLTNEASGDTRQTTSNGNRIFLVHGGSSGQLQANRESWWL